MIVRMPPLPPARRGRVGLICALAGLWLFASCTPSEDTEPFIPAREGPTQPAGNGSMLDAASACSRLRSAAEDAYDRLGCDDSSVADCPGFLGPAGGNGCYEYDEKSVSECESVYEDAKSCQVLPCVVTAVQNNELPGCELLENGAGGQGGQASSGGAPQGGEPTVVEAGAPAMTGAAGTPSEGGTGSGGAP